MINTPSSIYVKPRAGSTLEEDEQARELTTVLTSFAHSVFHDLADGNARTKILGSAPSVDDLDEGQAAISGTKFYVRANDKLYSITLNPE